MSDKLKRDITEEAFFALLRAGLWEKDFDVSIHGMVDYTKIYTLAKGQTVVGIIAAGMEHMQGVDIPKHFKFLFAGRSMSIENRNKDMNIFLGNLSDKMRNAGIYQLLLKGQGIAQCYERPLWRTSGDIDFFLNNADYEKAKAFLSPMANWIKTEGRYKQEYVASIKPWTVELHGTMRCGLSSKMDKVLDEISYDVFNCKKHRTWRNGESQIFLPDIDSDIIFVFTHFVKHFYCEGLGVRQICDWCRLLWTYRNEIDCELLELRLRKMGLLAEWRAFGAFAVEHLAMPSDSMPLYENARRWSGKAIKIKKFIMKAGNFGHNRDQRYFKKYSFLVRKTISLGRRINDLFQHTRIFPMETIKFSPFILYNGIRSAANGE